VTRVTIKGNGEAELRGGEGRMASNHHTDYLTLHVVNFV